MGQGVAGDDDVRRRRFTGKFLARKPLGAVMDEHLERAGESLQLAYPVADYGSRGEEESWAWCIGCRGSGVGCRRRGDLRLFFPGTRYPIPDTRFTFVQQQRD